MSLKVFTDFIKRMWNNSLMQIIMGAALIWAALMLIFIVMLNADLSAAPEFIYNQF